MYNHSKLNRHVFLIIINELAFQQYSFLQVLNVEENIMLGDKTKLVSDLAELQDRYTALEEKSLQLETLSQQCDALEEEYDALEEEIDKLEELQDAIALDMTEEIQQMDLEDEQREVSHRYMVQIKRLTEEIKGIEGQIEEIGNQFDILMKAQHVARNGLVNETKLAKAENKRLKDRLDHTACSQGKVFINGVLADRQLASKIASEWQTSKADSGLLIAIELLEALLSSQNISRSGLSFSLVVNVNTILKAILAGKNSITSLTALADKLGTLGQELEESSYLFVLCQIIRDGGPPSQLLQAPSSPSNVKTTYIKKSR